MQRLFEILLGLERTTTGGTTRWAVEWTGAPSGDWMLALLAGLIVLGVGAVWLYKHEARDISERWRFILAGLRIALLLAIIAMLMEPELVAQTSEPVPSTILVLVDRSASMDIRDAYPDPLQAQRVATMLKLATPAELRKQKRSELIDRVLDPAMFQKLASGTDRAVKVHAFAEQLSSGGDKAAEVPADQGRRTAVGTAIRQALADYRGQALAGILLVTDGQSNAGPPPREAAEAAKAAGVPITVLAAGTPEGPRNARIIKLDASPVAFANDPIEMRAIVESRGMKSATGGLLLERRRDGGEWQEVSRKPITLEEAGQLQTVVFDDKQEQPAAMEYRVKLETAETELTTDDNVASAAIRVVRQKIRVLLIAGSAFPEIQFLKNALQRDRGIELSSWLQSADAKYEHQGNKPIRRLPVNREELEEYDCVIAYDPDPRGLPPNFQELLADFVGKAGGGLVYVAGEGATKDIFETGEGQSQQKLLDLLPVVRDPGLFRSEVSVQLSAKNAWKLLVTPEGKADPLMRFNKDLDENQRVLASLPGMYWHFPVTRAKPGAVVLARHGDPRMTNEYGPHVLLATQLYGPGRTFFVGFDSTYRWRYLDEQYFDGFWARLVDRAGRNKLLGGRYPYVLSTDRADYSPGSPVTVRARFIDPTAADAAVPSLHGQIEHGDDPPLPITLNPGHEPGLFEATFTAAKAGPHFVRVWPGENDPASAVRPATLQFQVELPNVEYENPTQDRATLATIAKVSGGELLDLDQADRIPDAFKIHRVARVSEVRSALWNAPLLFGAFFLLIFGEWILRKRHRLV